MNEVKSTLMKMIPSASSIELSYGNDSDICVRIYYKGNISSDLNKGKCYRLKDCVSKRKVLAFGSSASRELPCYEFGEVRTQKVILIVVLS